MFHGGVNFLKIFCLGSTSESVVWQKIRLAVPIKSFLAVKKLLPTQATGLIFQLEGKKQIQTQSLNQNFYFASDLKSKNFNASDFHSKISQCLNFWEEIYTTRRILIQIFRNVSVGEIKILSKKVWPLSIWNCKVVPLLSNDMT